MKVYACEYVDTHTHTYICIWVFITRESVCEGGAEVKFWVQIQFLWMKQTYTYIPNETDYIYTSILDYYYIYKFIYKFVSVGMYPCIGIMPRRRLF